MGCPEHHRLGLDATHAPSEHSQPVDHRRMAVGPDQCIWDPTPSSCSAVSHRGDPFQIDLVDDAPARWDSGEIPKCSLAPFQEGVPFEVAVVFDVEVEIQGRGIGA